MAQLGSSFDPTQHEERRHDFELLASGWYAAQIIESDVVPTKSGRGKLCKLTWEIAEGDHAKRRVWQQITFEHDVAITQKIGQEMFAEICKALGLNGHVNDTNELHNIVCGVRIGQSKPQQGFDAKNEIKAVIPYGELAAKLSGAPAPKPATTAAKPGQQSAPQQQQRQAAPAATSRAPAGPATGNRPWAKAGATAG